MPYSAVTHPLPLLRRNGGTRSSTLAVQMTFVRPASMRTEPSACSRKWGVIVVSRSWFAGRWSDRIKTLSGSRLLAMALSYRLSAASLYPLEILRQRPPQIDVTGERVDLLAVNENLHRGDRGKIRGHRVDDGVNRQQLVDRAAWMLRDDLAAEIDEGLTVVGEEQ